MPLKVPHKCEKVTTSWSRWPQGLVMHCSTMSHKLSSKQIQSWWEWTLWWMAMMIFHHYWLCFWLVLLCICCIMMEEGQQLPLLYCVLPLRSQNRHKCHILPRLAGDFIVFRPHGCTKSLQKLHWLHRTINTSNALMVFWHINEDRTFIEWYDTKKNMWWYVFI